jgi:hypothetical protein
MPVSSHAMPASARAGWMPKTGSPQLNPRGGPDAVRPALETIALKGSIGIATERASGAVRGLSAARAFARYCPSSALLWADRRRGSGAPGPGARERPAAGRTGDAAAPTSVQSVIGVDPPPMSGRTRRA